MNRVSNYQKFLTTNPNIFQNMIGIVQFGATKDIDQNLQKSSIYIKKAAERGAKMVCLPENFAHHDQQVSGSKHHHKTITNIYDQTIDQNKSLLKKYCSLAVENQVWLSLGGYQELCKDRVTGEIRTYMSHFIINETGAIVEKYRKMHPFNTRVL